MTVGLIGIGEIGTIALHGLIAAGLTVSAYDVNLRAVSGAVAAGAGAAGTVAELAAECSTVLVAVADGTQVREVVADLARVMRGGHVVIHSTVGPRLVRELADIVAPAIVVLDAALSVRRTDDLRRCLAFVGSAEPVSDAVRDVLNAYCHEVALVGGPGAGQVAKLANNVMSLVNTAAAAEALRLAAAAGIDVDVMCAMAMRGSGDSHALRTWPVRADLFGGGPGAAGRQRGLAAKDLAAALAYAAEVGVELPLTGAALDALG